MPRAGARGGVCARARGSSRRSDCIVRRRSRFVRPHIRPTCPSTSSMGRSVEYVAEQIETAAEQCSRIVGNFLALARKHPPERRRAALNRTVTEAVEPLAYPLNLDTVRVELDLAADLPDLWADQHQLQQVVVNVLTNAHHALRQTSSRQ